MHIDLDLQHLPPLPRNRNFRIGAVGAGFIMRDIQLAAYAKAGFTVEAIASRDPHSAALVASARRIPKAYGNYQELLRDESIQVIDIAVPPDRQLEVVRDVVEAQGKTGHIRGVLAQKPLGMTYGQAREIVELCEQAGITLAVNQNMRYDQSIRALKTVLTRGYLGEPVLGTIDMRAIPHWAPWVQPYGKLTLLVMSIHHLDAFRYLFGNPDSVYVSARQDPRTRFAHTDGIPLYILEYDSGFRAASWDDVWAGPAREGGAPDLYIRWRVEGTEGMARGTIGWPAYPNAEPSTIDFTTAAQPGVWFSPRWSEVWFPDAFWGTMGQLLDALDTRDEPLISGRDNLKTMALVDACYRSLAEHRPVRIREIEEEAS
jgi:predicted dehydrogenase